MIVSIRNILKVTILGLIFSACGKFESSVHNTHDNTYIPLTDQSLKKTVDNGNSLQLKIDAPSNGSGFQKYLYSFPLPAGQFEFTGLSGTVSMDLLTSTYSEALISLHYLTSGSCPSNGTHYSTYDQIYKAYPGLTGIQNIILKQPDPGTSVINVNMSLPAGLPIAGCIVAVLDGGPASGSSSIVMHTDLSLSYEPIQSNPAYLLGGGSEFCFGQNYGCQAATTDNSLSFSFATVVPQDSYLLALTGDISDSTFDGTHFGPVPKGNWSMNNDFYVLPGGCGPYTPGSATAAADYYAILPKNAQQIASVPFSGSGKTVLQQYISESFSNLQLRAGDCIVALTKMNGQGGVDAENQVSYVLVPHTAPPAPVVTGPTLLPVYRLFKTKGGDHLYSAKATEALSLGYQLEGIAFYLSTQQGPGMAPLYRCRAHWGDHFLSEDSKCEGQIPEGILGYMETFSTSDTAALFRFYRPSIGHHLETTSQQEGLNAKFNYEGILGYVW
jgi:hypothetical protein